MSSNMIAREHWIDVLKGFGILAVVIGHITYNKTIVELIFLFHMPLFFLVGGWLDQNQMPLRAFILSKLNALIVPYLCFICVLWPLELWLNGQLNSTAIDFNKLIWPILFGGQALTGAASVLWFITCYFLTQLLGHMFLLKKQRFITGIVICSALSIAYVMSRYLPNVALPWNLQTVFFALALYLLGALARDHNVLKDTWIKGLFLLGCLIIAWLFWKKIPNTLDLKYDKYGIPLVTLWCSLSCVGLLALLSRQIEKNYIGIIFAALGRASMTIMFLHQPIQLFVAKKLGLMQAAPRIGSALLISMLFHQIFSEFVWTRRLLLGKSNSNRGKILDFVNTKLSRKASL